MPARDRRCQGRRDLLRVSASTCPKSSAWGGGGGGGAGWGGGEGGLRLVSRKRQSKPSHGVDTIEASGGWQIEGQLTSAAFPKTAELNPPSRVSFRPLTSNRYWESERSQHEFLPASSIWTWVEAGTEHQSYCPRTNLADWRYFPKIDPGHARPSKGLPLKLGTPRTVSLCANTTLLPSTSKRPNVGLCLV